MFLVRYSQLRIVVLLFLLQVRVKKTYWKQIKTRYNHLHTSKLTYMSIKREKIEHIKKVLFTLYPDAKTELHYENTFQLLVAIIMSAQTTDKQVNKVNETFFQVLKTPQDGVKLWEEAIKKAINRVNFFNNKGKSIYKLCQLLSQAQWKIPQKLEELVKFPWVGIKTAKVFLAVVHDAPLLAVDTHVHRVLNRLWVVKAKTPLETNAQAEKIFTTDDNAKLHHSLIFFGRYHCTARSPKCGKCELQDVCAYYKKNPTK